MKLKARFKVAGFRMLGTGHKDYGLGIVRMHQSWADELSIGRHSLLRISRHDERYCRYRSVFAVFRGSDIAKDTIALEHDDRSKLGVVKDENSFVDLVLEKAPIHGYFLYMCTHPDIVVRINFLLTLWLTLISMIVGLLVAVAFFLIDH